MKTKEALRKLVREKFSQMSQEELKAIRKAIDQIKKRKAQK